MIVAMFDGELQVTPDYLCTDLNQFVQDLWRTRVSEPGGIDGCFPLLPGYVPFGVEQKDSVRMEIKTAGTDETGIIIVTIGTVWMRPSDSPSRYHVKLDYDKSNPFMGKREKLLLEAIVERLREFSTQHTQSGAAMVKGQGEAGELQPWEKIPDSGWVETEVQAVDAQEVVAPAVAQPPKAKTTPTETFRASLRKNLVEWFNDSELRGLCFDMNVDYETLSGDNKADKARELVSYCERRQIIPDLVVKCRELRPKVSWEGEYE
jgi:hypothetical protein